MKKSLEQQAAEFARSRPRQNPPDADEVDELVQSFIIEKKTEGEELSSWTEEEWREALTKLGVPDDFLGSFMEDVAAWGVDD